MSFSNGTCDICGKPAQNLHCKIEDVDRQKAAKYWLSAGHPPDTVPAYCDDCMRKEQEKSS